MLTVASYMKVIPPGNSNPEKPALLKNFIQGVNGSGDRGVVCQTYHPIDTDVAVIQGFVHANSKNSPHLKLRREVYENQRRRNKRCIIVDSNLFLAYDPGNTKGYLRYSYDGIFANSGEYCYSAETADPRRWAQISQQLGIQVKDWRMRDHGHILIACQRDGGWSMQGQNVIQWLEANVKRIRETTDAPILVRFHPGDKQKDTYAAKIKHLDVVRSTSDSLLHDLKNARAFVGHNSSPAVVAAIEGVPVFLTDAGRSQAKEVAHTNFRDIIHPKPFDRSVWLQKLGMCHWTQQELQNGECWRHMRKWAI